jgi:hypothetical protein
VTYLLDFDLIGRVGYKKIPALKEIELGLYDKIKPCLRRSRKRSFLSDLGKRSLNLPFFRASHHALRNYPFAIGNH